jgi:hypothetical protein
VQRVGAVLVDVGQTPWAGELDALAVTGSAPLTAAAGVRAKAGLYALSLIASTKRLATQPTAGVGTTVATLCSTVPTTAASTAVKPMCARKHLRLPPRVSHRFAWQRALV